MGPESMGHDESEGRTARVPIAVPAVLISCGLLFLMSNLNVLPVGGWDLLVRLWPIALVIVGIETIVNRLRLWPNWASVLLVIATVGLILGTALNWPWTYGDSRGGNSYELQMPPLLGDRADQRTVEIDELDEPIGNAKEAEIDLSIRVGDLHIGALETGSGTLVGGRVAYGNYRQAPRKEVATGDEHGLFTMSSRGSTGIILFPFVNASDGETWDLKLNKDVPLTMRIKLDAARAWVDLSALRVTDVDADVDAGSVDITVPAAGRTRVHVKSDAAVATLRIPDGVAARIHVVSDVSSISVDEKRFPRRGDYFQSNDYGYAASQVELEVDADVSTITVR